MRVLAYSRGRGITLGMMALGGFIAGGLVLLGARPSAQQTGRPDGFISGDVASSKGAEAGVWVIAETNDLPTKFIKIVVTDDTGKFVLPELPKATYSVWVRGYGLVDSARVNATPGATLSLKADLAKTRQEAAQIYPSNYWLSLLQIPPKTAFPGTGTGPGGNGISTDVKTQAWFINRVQQGCQDHHQLGGKVTRDISHMKNFDSTQAAWDYRLKTGQRGDGMSAAADQAGRPAILKMFADWTDRIAAGEVPPAPPRPKGIERNLVLTMWDWAAENAFLHDLTSTDRRNPSVNAGGPVYAVSAGHGKVTIVDLAANSSKEITVPTREDPNTVPTRHPQTILEPSNWWGRTLHWGDTPDKKGDPHNPMMDGKGRIWMTSRIRGPVGPAWCKDGALNKYAAYFPLVDGEPRQARQASYYDPKTGKFALIDTCFGTHHLNFDSDANDTLWLSGDTNVVGWIDTKKYDETGDEQASQGWCPLVLDTNGDGTISKPWNEPGKPIDAALDTRIRTGAFFYGVASNPVDHSVWVTMIMPFPGAVVRLDRGKNPPETCIAEIYEPPLLDDFRIDKAKVEYDPMIEMGYGEEGNIIPANTGHSPRGLDVDAKGVVWTALAGSGHLANFDRRKCGTRNGPKATGQHCKEGWALSPNPGPKLKGVTDSGSADFHYFNWVDRFNTLGLGENLPMTVGTGSDSLQVQMPPATTDRARAPIERIVFRVPYPLGFYSRGMDGRIDDPNSGWKGRGLWAAFSTQILWQLEGGKGTRSKAVHFQLRPDPLAH